MPQVLTSDPGAWRQACSEHQISEFGISGVGCHLGIRSDIIMHNYDINLISDGF